MTNQRLLTKMLLAVGAAVLLNGCGSKYINTDPEEYDPSIKDKGVEKLSTFHHKYFASNDTWLDEGKLALYVDYSTCCVMGQHSPFFQEVQTSLCKKANAYYAIRGSQIDSIDIDANGGVYSLLRNITEVNYADLKTAAERMAAGNTEAVMITDGEYYTPNIAKGHINDPYLADAFEQWLLKGHDIHIISEPYLEPYNDKQYAKKRFYIIFTDDRLQDNIYERIANTVSFGDYEGVEECHLAISHPSVKEGYMSVTQTHPILQCKQRDRKGTPHEIQDWTACDWKTIEQYIVSGVDSVTGKPLPNGEAVLAMGINKGSLGCYEITSLSVTAYDINEAFVSYLNGEKSEAVEIDNFMLIDKPAFDRNGSVFIHFNQEWFGTYSMLGNPYNYIKVDIAIDEVKQTFSQMRDQFVFEDISNPQQLGVQNLSMIKSIEQCLASKEVKEKLRKQVIHSIYIISDQQ